MSALQDSFLIIPADSLDINGWPTLVLSTLTYPHVRYYISTNLPVGALLYNMRIFTRTTTGNNAERIYQANFTGLDPKSS